MKVTSFVVGPYLHITADEQVILSWDGVDEMTTVEFQLPTSSGAMVALQAA